MCLIKCYDIQLSYSAFSTTLTKKNFLLSVASSRPVFGISWAKNLSLKKPTNCPRPFAFFPLMSVVYLRNVDLSYNSTFSITWGSPPGSPSQIYAAANAQSGLLLNIIMLIINGSKIITISYFWQREKDEDGDQNRMPMMIKMVIWWKFGSFDAILHQESWILVKLPPKSSFWFQFNFVTVKE